MVELTVREFIENIRKNGLPKTHKVLFAGDGFAESVTYGITGTITAACAMGQGLINSGAEFNPYSNVDSFKSRLYDAVWHLNDDYESDLSLPEIADSLLLMFENDLSRIIYFNDFDYSPYLETPVNV